MRKRYTFATASLLIAGSLTAQDCTIPFVTPLFEVQVESDLWYGNATRFDGGTDSLRLNLYKPVGDGQLERPLVIAVHGGGFVNGNREDLNAYCNTLASMGWSCATITYRLGFYGTGIVDPPYAYDPPEVRRAIHRAMQDAKGAVRFMKGRHLQDSTSTTNVLFVGFSAGSIAAMHATYVDRPEEKHPNANAIGDVQHFLNFYPRPDLGDVDGDLNQNGNDASVLGIVNCFGALMDTAYIESAEDPALYSYHQTLDPVVGCGTQRPYWGIGLGVPDNYPYLMGSCTIDPHIQTLGYSEGRYKFTLHQGNEHDIHDPVGILQESLQWMRDLFCGISTSTLEATPSITPRLFPNPTTGMLNLEGLSTPSTFEMRDMLGRLVGSGTSSSQTETIDLASVPDGIYLLHVTGKGQLWTERIVLER